jgi:hypothetical protein
VIRTGCCLDTLPRGIAAVEVLDGLPHGSMLEVEVPPGARTPHEEHRTSSRVRGQVRA